MTNSPGRRRCTVIDLETTGLDARSDHIIQIAAVSIDLTDSDGVVTGSLDDEWSTLVRPSRPWRPIGAREIHGIGRRRLVRGASLTRALAELDRRLRGRVAVAHNLAFDWGFIEQAHQLLRLAAPDPARACTLNISRSLDPSRQRQHRLADLCERYGVVLCNAHDALADARATAMVLPALITEAGGLGALPEETLQVSP